MNQEIYLIYGVSFGILAAALLFILAGKYILIGLKVFFAKMLYKENAGLILFINKSGKILFPKVANFGKSTYKTKKKLYALPKEVNGSIFGLPYIFLNTDDVCKSAGIYYPVSDDDGNQIYYKDEDGEHIIDEKGDKIPKYSTIKEGASFDPDFLTSVILDQALTAALKDLFSKQKNLLIFIMVAAGASVAAAYFSYDFTQNQLPQLMSLARTAASCATNGVSP